MEEGLKLFEQSLERLEEILEKEKTIAYRDAAIKRFEFTVELAWKTIQKFLRNQGIMCRSPKECLREAFKFKLIEDDPLWLKMLDDRNLTSHTYNEELAEEIHKRLPIYLNLLYGLKDSLRQEKNKL